MAHDDWRIRIELPDEGGAQDLLGRLGLRQSGAEDVAWFERQGDAVPALIRFSNGGGDPEGHDAQREARGMAVKLRPPNGAESDILRRFP